VLFKDIILISNNKILLSWCCAEVESAIKVTQVDDVADIAELCAVANTCCFFVDYASAGEVEILARYRYLLERFNLPVIFLTDKAGMSAHVRKTYFRDVPVVSVYAPSGTLRQTLSHLLEIPIDAEITAEKQKQYVVKTNEMIVSAAEQEAHDAQYELALAADTYDIFSGNSLVIRKFRDQVIKAARSDDVVLLLGESGCGKSYTAKFIHEHSVRKGKEFCSLNVAELTQSIAESQLFGTEAGAYTGAVEKDGLFAAADKGTLFLDEIGELAPALQSKLLDVIESSTYRRVGSMTPRTFNARLVFATNIDLKKCIAKGTFRKDLFYRIAVLEVKVPALREHRDDIPYLANRFAVQRDKQLSEQALQKLISYPWPGNIRELHNVLIRACTFCSSRELLPDDIVF